MSLCNRCPILACTVLICAAAAGWAADGDNRRADAYGDPLPAEALLRLGPARFRTEENVRVALSPDGKTLALVDREAVVLIDAASGKERKRLQHDDQHGIGMVVFSPDGRKFVAAMTHGFQVYDAVSGKRLAILEATNGMTGRGMPGTAAFSQDGKRLAVGTDFVDGKPTALVWDADTLKKLQSMEIVQDYQAHVALSGDGKILATWSQHLGLKGGPDLKRSRLVQLWDTATGKELKTIEIAGYKLLAVALSPSGEQLAVVEGRNATLSLWEVASGKNLHRLPVRRTSGSLLAYSPDGKRLAVGDDEGAVQLFEAATGKRLGMGVGPTCSVEGIAFLADDKVLAAGSRSQALHLWEVPLGHVLTPREGHTTPPTSVAFNPDGKSVLSAASDGIQVWDAATGKPGRHLTLPENARLGPRIDTPRYLLSPDGRQVLCGSVYDEGLMRLVEVATERELFGLRPPFDHRELNATFSSDGTTLAVTGVDTNEQTRPNVVQVWNLADGREGGAWMLKSSDSLVTAISPDGRFVLTAANRDGRDGAGPTSELSLWDAATGKQRWTQRRQHQTTRLAFSPTGEFFAVAQQAGLYLGDKATGAEQRPLENTDDFQASALAFSPDGRTLAVGELSRLEAGGTARVCLWEMATAKRRGELAGHRGAVSALVFSPDGRTLASGGRDTTVLLWDLTGRRYAQVQAAGKPRAADFDALWTQLADADAEKAYRLVQRLTLYPAEAAALVKAKLPRATIDRTAIDKWIADLDHNDFERRQQAHQALAATGKAARTALMKAMEGRPSAEKKRQLTDLLDALQSIKPHPEMVRPTRALEVLERLGTPEAKQVLEDLAKGDADAPLTLEAKTTLKRLAAQAKPSGAFKD
jgi:WD40 repeat protein